jgi:hypothetical protein
MGRWLRRSSTVRACSRVVVVRGAIVTEGMTEGFEMKCGYHAVRRRVDDFHIMIVTNDFSCARNLLSYHVCMAVLESEYPCLQLGLSQTVLTLLANLSRIQVPKYSTEDQLSPHLPPRSLSSGEPGALNSIANISARHTLFVTLQFNALCKDES